MAELQFAVIYDGRDASAHRIDMRRYGRALIGVDRIVNAGLIGLTERRIPTGRERNRLLIDVSQPKPGSVEAIGVVMAVYQGLQPYLPFILEQMKKKGVDIVWTWLAACFNVLGGRPNEAEKLIDKLVEFMNDVDERHVADRQREREAWQTELENTREFVLRLIDAQRSAARDVVSPLGTSASELRLGHDASHVPTEIDEAMAASVRSNTPIIVGDLETVDIEIDGFRRSQGNVWVRRIAIDDDWIKADVRDPSFDESHNQYMEAASTGAALKVAAKPTYKDGGIFKLFILHTVDPKGSAIAR
jgi:hypothetical protein